MKTPWTPGPWTLGDENNASAEVCMGDVAASFDRYSRDPGKCGQMVIEREEMLANAHLTIAAPDLAEALTKLVEAGPGPENAPAKAKARVAVCSACGRKHADLTSRGRVVLVGADGLCGGCRDTEREES